MIAQNGGFVGTYGFSDFRAFTRLSYQYSCVVIENVILKKSTRLLVDWIKASTESRPSSAIGRMRVCGGIYRRPRLVNFVVDREGRDVNGSTPFQDLTLRINAHQIGPLYLSEMHAKRIHPKAVGDNGITHRNVATNSLAIPKAARIRKPAAKRSLRCLRSSSSDENTGGRGRRKIGSSSTEFCCVDTTARPQPNLVTCFARLATQSSECLGTV